MGRKYRLEKSTPLVDVTVRPNGIHIYALTEEGKAALIRMRYDGVMKQSEIFRVDRNLIIKWRKQLGISETKDMLRERSLRQIHRWWQTAKDDPQVREKVMSQIQKMNEACRKKRERDIRRMKLGLPQASNLRISLESKVRRSNQAAARKRLKEHGYILTEEKDVIYYNKKTHRLPYSEKVESKVWHWTFLEENEKETYVRGYDETPMNNQIYY